MSDYRQAAFDAAFWAARMGFSTTAPGASADACRGTRSSTLEAAQPPAGSASTLAGTAQADVTTPRVRVRLTTPSPPAPPPTPSRPSCEPASLRADLTLTPGAVRLHDLLVQLANSVMDARGYRAHPDRVLFHAPAFLVAAALGYTDRHIRRLAGELSDAGLLAYGGHAARVKGRNLWDGTLWCVKTTTNATRPRIRPDEWRHVWRDLEHDLNTGQTAMSELKTQEPKSEGIYNRLKAWAVGARQTTLPVESSSDMRLLEVIYTLGDLSSTHPAQCGDLITRYARAIAHGLRDDHSRRFYAGLLHQAVSAEYRGIKALSALQHALQRVLVDIAEWPDLERPGALLLSRLRKSGVWDALTAP